jgi:prevent-host-death family protein
MVMKVLTQPKTRTIPAGQFKARCLRIMDDVSEGNLTVIVTKRGRPVAQLTAPVSEAKPFRSLFGRTPGIKIPTQAEWKKLKAQFASEWADPADKLARAEQQSHKQGAKPRRA